MSKKTTSMIYSEDLSNCIGIPTPHIDATMRDLAARGLIDRTTVQGADGRGVLINLLDLVILSSELKLPVDQAKAALDHWRDNSQPFRYVEQKIRRAVATKGVIEAVLGDKPLLRNSVVKVYNGELCANKAAKELGFRIEGDYVWIAPSHSYLSMLIRRSRRTPEEFALALNQIKGATRVPPKKFSGATMRSISVPIAGFLDATESKPAGE